MPQMVSRLLLTAEARVRARIIPFGFHDAKNWHFNGARYGAVG